MALMRTPASASTSPRNRGSSGFSAGTVCGATTLSTKLRRSPRRVTDEGDGGSAASTMASSRLPPGARSGAGGRCVFAGGSRRTTGTGFCSWLQVRISAAASANIAGASSFRRTSRSPWNNWCHGIQQTAARRQVRRRGTLRFRRRLPPYDGNRFLFLGPGADLGGGLGKSRRCFQFPPHLAQPLEQLVLLVDPVRMKIVQFPETHPGKGRGHALQHFLEIVAIDFHGLPTCRWASAEIAQQQNVERSLGFEHRGGWMGLRIDIQVYGTEGGLDRHGSQTPKQAECSKLSRNARSRSGSPAVGHPEWVTWSGSLGVDPWTGFLVRQNPRLGRQQLLPPGLHRRGVRHLPRQLQKAPVVPDFREK